MDKPRPIIAINYYFTPAELNNRIFAPDSNFGKAIGLKAFRAFMDARGVDVVTLDTVDFHDPNVKFVLYFEYNWRLLFSDSFLRHIPYEKRAIVLIEPANINPSLYFTSLLRDRFNIVFTWDLKLLKRNHAYSRINVSLGAEPENYRDNLFKDKVFADKRFLVAVSANRGSYMPQSTYRIRRQAYRYFERAFPEQFDLFGMGWNAPRYFYERWFGYPRFSSWRGEIMNTSDAKVRRIADYKFALCFENNASEPGYISEKITDCFCARCVPVYYGSPGIEEMIPHDTWIDLRDFRSFAELGFFLSNMDEAAYKQYINAIDRFMKSDQIKFFSTDHLFRVIAARMGVPEGRTM
jgi:hypothetical protein